MALTAKQCTFNSFRIDKFKYHMTAGEAGVLHWEANLEKGKPVSGGRRKGRARRKRGNI